MHNYVNFHHFQSLSILLSPDELLKRLSAIVRGVRKLLLLSNVRIADDFFFLFVMGVMSLRGERSSLFLRGVSILRLGISFSLSSKMG